MNIGDKVTVRRRSGRIEPGVVAERPWHWPLGPGKVCVRFDRLDSDGDPYWDIEVVPLDMIWIESGFRSK